MGKIFIPGESPLFSEEDVIPNVVNGSPARAITEIVGVENVSSLVAQGKNGRTVAAELRRKGISVESFVRDSLRELMVAGKMQGNAEAKTRELMSHTARVGGPLSIAVKAILDDPTFRPSESHR